MALPFLNSSKRRESVIAIDLGGRTTKAVEVKRRGEKFVLSRFSMLEAPVYDKAPSPEMMGEHLKNVADALGASTKSACVALDLGNSMVRHAELPQMTVGDMRQVLKNSSKTYLQQDLPGHVYDCHITLQRNSKNAEKPKGPTVTPKVKVLVAAARKQLVDDVHSAVKNAGLSPEVITPGLIAPVNAFELAMPEVFSKEAVAIIDFGFRNTSICLLSDGELVLTRVVGIGGDKLTAGLAEAMGISYAEAESIKVGIPSEVQTALESLVLPLGRELRASIDCFENQEDRPVTQVYICGASAQSEFLIQTLQAELMLECKTWNPIGFAQLELKPEQATEIDNAAPHLTVAVGAALAAFN